MKTIIITILLIGIFQIDSVCQNNSTKVEIQFVKKGYDGYEEFANQAADYLERVINSDKFRDRIKRGIFKRTKGYSNLEIHQIIMDGFEKDCPERKRGDVLICPEGEKGIINLMVRTIDNTDHGKWLNKNCNLDSRARTIGIDGSGDGVTAICPQRLELWFKEKRVDKLAGHYMHEYMHILGFDHYKGKKSKSAVYKIGNIVRELVLEQIILDNYKCNLEK